MRKFLYLLLLWNKNVAMTTTTTQNETLVLAAIAIIFLGGAWFAELAELSEPHYSKASIPVTTRVGRI